MERALLEVMQKRNAFYNKSINCKVNGVLVKHDDIQPFLNELVTFSQVIKQCPESTFENFIRRNAVKLSMLRMTLIVDSPRHVFHHTLEQDVKKSLMAVYNVIYSTLKYKQYWENKERLASKTFTEFCKGVTYFKSEFQPTRWPMYHRNASCGSGRLTSDSRFVRTLYGPDSSKYVTRCLLERRIYDLIYTHIVGMQDIGHKYELEKVQRIYEKYHPEEAIKIGHIDFEGMLPIRVQVDVYIANTIVSSEIYEKTSYNINEYMDDVYCYKKDLVKQTCYEKVQTFDNAKEWSETSDIDTTPNTQSKIILFSNAV